MVQPELVFVLEQLAVELELGVEMELVVEVELAVEPQVVESEEVHHWKPMAKGQLPFSLVEAGLVVVEAILALLR